MAQVGDITLALCSADDLEQQRERGFDMPEGWQRNPECLLGYGREMAERVPVIWANEYGKWTTCFDIVVTQQHITGGHLPQLNEIDYDLVWQNRLEWAERRNQE